jgi:hypothetical protein
MSCDKDDAFIISRDATNEIHFSGETSVIPKEGKAFQALYFMISSNFPYYTSLQQGLLIC